MRLAWVALLALGVAGCAPDGPHVVLAISADGAPYPINNLTRLRLEVRACGEGQLPVLQDLDTTAPTKIEAALIPGHAYYVWLQGWVQCQPPCVPTDNAVHGADCECFTGLDPPDQLLGEEYCSNWMRTSEGRTEVTATLAAVVAGRCPPAPLSDCNSPP